MHIVWRILLVAKIYRGLLTVSKVLKNPISSLLFCFFLKNEMPLKHFTARPLMSDLLEPVSLYFLSVN